MSIILSRVTEIDDLITEIDRILGTLTTSSCQLESTVKM